MVEQDLAVTIELTKVLKDRNFQGENRVVGCTADRFGQSRDVGTHGQSDEPRGRSAVVFRAQV